jgi:probable rRNA maturation factor
MAVYAANETTDEIDLDGLLAVARHVVVARRIPQEMELSILVVDRESMAALNAEHMGGDGPTDVLAFPIDEPGESSLEGPSVLGDVVLCPAVATEQALKHGRTAQQELQMLTVHGILHLLGMDHDSPERERVMFQLTDDLLAEYEAAK